MRTEGSAFYCGDSVSFHPAGCIPRISWTHKNAPRPDGAGRLILGKEALSDFCQLFPPRFSVSSGLMGIGLGVAKRQFADIDQRLFLSHVHRPGRPVGRQTGYMSRQCDP